MASRASFNLAVSVGQLINVREIDRGNYGPGTAIDIKLQDANPEINGIVAGCTMPVRCSDGHDPKGTGGQQYRDYPCPVKLSAGKAFTRSTYSIEPKWGRGAVASPYPSTGRCIYDEQTLELNAIGFSSAGMDRHAHWSHRINADFMRSYRLPSICHLHNQPTCVRHPDADPPDAIEPLRQALR